MVTGKELKRKSTNGFRPGIEREQLIKSLDDNDWRHIKLMKELDNSFIKNPDALSFAIRTDQLYQDYMNTNEAVDGVLVNILMNKIRIDKNMSDILKGETERVFGDNKIKLTVRDLEVENINLQRNLNKDLRNMYLLMADLYRHVDKIRIDKKVYFTNDQYTEKVKYIKDEFKKQNIKLFKD